MFFQEKGLLSSRRTDYAEQTDFMTCFERDMKSLYLLAFLLTANHADAEKCFAATVEEASRQNSVFREWAKSWIRRRLIQNAIRIAEPQTEHKNRKRDLWASDTQAHVRGREFDAITKLVPLARFVFVVTVLERYSIAECALLLKLTKNEVAEARSGAISDLAAQLSHSEILTSDSTNPFRGFTTHPVRYATAR